MIFGYSPTYIPCNTAECRCRTFPTCYGDSENCSEQPKTNEMGIQWAPIKLLTFGISHWSAAPPTLSLSESLFYNQLRITPCPDACFSHFVKSFWQKRKEVLAVLILGYNYGKLVFFNIRYYWMKAKNFHLMFIATTSFVFPLFRHKQDRVKLSKQVRHSAFRTKKKRTSWLG